MKYVGFLVCGAMMLVSLIAMPKASALQCQVYFKVQTQSEILYRGYVKSKESGKYFLKIEKPKGAVKNWFVLVHGLLDSSRGWDDVAPLLLEQGYGVIRLDLKGHGKTLYQEYKSSLKGKETYETPYQIPMEDNVVLVENAIKGLKKFGIKKPILIGHSMGGAVALAVAARAEITGLVHPKAILISTYVYRLDRRAMEKTFSNYFWGFTGWNIFFDLMPGFYRDFIERWLTDYFSDPVLYKHYQEFAKSKILEADMKITPEQLKRVIRYHIKAGMAVTKGLRDFDALALAKKFSEKNQFLIILGREDELLDIALQKKLASALPNTELVVEDNASHMVINQKPQEVVNAAIRFIETN